MKIDLRTNRDFWAGVHYIVFGAVAMYMAMDYPFGSALRMGPGYFPRVLSGILIAFGVYTIWLGLRNQEKIKPGFSLRGLVLLTVATIVFGAMIDTIGFVPAMLALIVLSALAGQEFKWLEVTMLAIGMTVACALLFIYALGLPYPLVGGH